MLRPFSAVGIILAMLVAACAAPTPTPTATPAPTLALEATPTVAPTPTPTLEATPATAPTPTALPIPAPVGLTVHNVGIKTATISWEEVAGINTYHYRVRRATSSVEVRTRRTGQNEVTFDGLICGFDYHVSVRGLTAVRAGEWSEPLQFSTLPCPTATPVPPPTPTPTPPPGAVMSNPVPVGSAIAVTSQSYYNKDKTFDITITEVIRGQRAFQRLLDVNRYNDAPDAGHEWLLFKVRVSYLPNQEGVADDFDEEILVVSSRGFVYDEEGVVEPEPNLGDVALWPGAVQEAWIAWQVAVDDAHPLMLFGSRDYEGGQWFSLKPPIDRTPTPSSPSIVDRRNAISAGGFHTCAIRLDGSPVCWGDDAEGRASPPDERFVAISSGFWHTCALRSDGSALCWGRNRDGQASPPYNEHFSSISSGRTHTCALREDGSAFCWGRNSDGQASPPQNGRFVSISSGSEHTCALRADGAPACWGDNEFGQASPPDGGPFSSISSGGAHTCASRQDGDIVCWGNEAFRQTSSPFGERFSSVSSGGLHTCALRASGSVACWGGLDWESSPNPNERFASISSGNLHTCALRSDGMAVCWGASGSGQASPPWGERFAVGRVDVGVDGRGAGR